jgi:hypothetical protein
MKKVVFLISHGTGFLDFQFLTLWDNFLAYMLLAAIIPSSNESLDLIPATKNGSHDQIKTKLPATSHYLRDKT